MMIVILAYLVISSAISPKALAELEYNIYMYRLNELAYTGIDDFGNNTLSDFQLAKFKLSSNDRMVLKFTRKKNLETLLEGYLVYEVINKDCAYFDSKTVKTAYPFSIPLPCECYNKFLIAYDLTSEDILYLGGAFYRDLISDIWTTDQVDFNELVRIKFYHYDLTKINSSRKRKKVVVTAWSSTLNQYVKFQVDKENPDHVKEL